MHPFYKGFKGQIIKISDTQYISKGNYSLEGGRLVITELPVGEWTDKYIRFLEDNILSEKSDIILDFDNYSTEKDISIKIKLSSDFIYDNKTFKVTNGITEFEKKLKLTSSISLTNIHAYDRNNIIRNINLHTKYLTNIQLLEHHFITKEIYIY